MKQMAMKTHLTPSLIFSTNCDKQEALWQNRMCAGVYACMHACEPLTHPDSVGLSQPYRIGQLDLDLSTVEGAKHTHHLQQTIIQPAGAENIADMYIISDL